MPTIHYLTMLFVGLGTSFAADLSGTWHGTYGYSQAREWQVDPVPFTIGLKSDPEGVVGTSTEPNTFGRPDVRELKARITITSEVDDQVEFVKQYDGTGGVTHAVIYRGTVAAGTIVGTWSIGRNTGPFTMTRTWPTTLD